MNSLTFPTHPPLPRTKAGRRYTGPTHPRTASRGPPATPLTDPSKPLLEELLKSVRSRATWIGHIICYGHGENIPVVEIEGILYRHPAVKQIAIVSIPDERLGERACAFVVPHAEAALDLSAITTFLEDNQVARSYWPERLEIVEALPQTASGKIQKFKLREIAKNLRVAAA
jgi:hypothetical protein